MANINTIGLYPPQLVQPPHFTILESFHQTLPHYDYDGKAKQSSLGTTTGTANPPRYGLLRPATTSSAAGGQPVANLWQDIGFRLINQIKNKIDINWVQLQPIWQQTQQVYNRHYRIAYTAAASANQPPASFQQSFPDPQRAIEVWNDLDQTRRNLLAEREGDKAGRDAVSAWIVLEEIKLVSEIQGVLTPYVQHWINWVDSYSAEREHVSMKEQGMQHSNEADVVRAAAMYLVHPVMAALDALPTTSGSFILKSEDVNNNNNTVRTDITFYRFEGTGVSRAISVMEFKRRGVIRPNQFEAAIAAGAPAHGPAGAPAHGPAGATLFEGEALKLIKQAATYATTFQTKHVVLCDWSYLVLCYFVDMPYNNPSNAGVRVQIQILPVGNPSTTNRLGFYNSVNSHLFRPALLGFLKSAYDETPRA